MGMLEALASALRNYSGSGAVDGQAAKQTAGQDGMAGKMNGQRRKEYQDYVIDQQSQGASPIDYNAWYAQKYGNQ